MNDVHSAHPSPQREGPLRSQDIPWRARIRVGAIWLATLAVITAVLAVRLPFTGQVTLQVGDVAPRDIIAPRQITYISEILTEQRRTAAANAVGEVYDPPQARIGRQQLALTVQILDYIASVRSDSFADAQLKASYIAAITALDLPQAIIDRIVALPGPAWDRVAAEIQVVLERAMREEIRENNLADERRKVAARVRLDLADEDAAIVTAVVQDLLVPNSFYNAERTEQRRQAARDATEPVTNSVERNETILRAGDLVTSLDIEVLKALGLQQATWSWTELTSTVGFVALLGVIWLYYLWRQEPQLWFRTTELIIMALVIVLAVLAAKIMLPARALLPYLYPYAALTIILAIVINERISLVVTGLAVLFIGWLTNGNVEIMAYGLAGMLVGVLKLRRGDRLANFAWTALYVAVADLLVVLAMRFMAATWDVRGLAELVIAAFVNGLIVVTVTLVGLYLIGALFGVTTPLQLMEISRPTHPLLRQLLLKAPGTYHHTLLVSNMVERAAEAIGADALLARVGAYYHDVGKTIRPYFFVENRTEALDPHARLDPYTSAQIIITHVKDGIDLARKYRLPSRVIDFIPEHQGTLLVSYFYHQAVQQAGSPEAVDKAQFCYPGPKPQSRETALTMLADGAEATVRARHPASIEELELVVNESIQSRLLSGQLDESPLTVADLSAVHRAFVDVLRGLHHPRINYPADIARASASAPAAAPVAPPEPSKKPAQEPPDAPRPANDQPAF